MLRTASHQHEEVSYDLFLIYHFSYCAKMEMTSVKITVPRALSVSSSLTNCRTIERHNRA